MSKVYFCHNGAMHETDRDGGREIYVRASDFDATHAKLADIDPLKAKLADAEAKLAYTEAQLKICQSKTEDKQST